MLREEFKIVVQVWRKLFEEYCWRRGWRSKKGEDEYWWRGRIWEDMGGEFKVIVKYKNDGCSCWMTRWAEILRIAVSKGGGRCGWEDMEDVAEELTILIRCEEE